MAEIQVDISASDNKISVIFYLGEFSDNYADSDAGIYTEIHRGKRLLTHKLQLKSMYPNSFDHLFTHFCQLSNHKSFDGIWNQN